MASPRAFMPLTPIQQDLAATAWEFTRVVRATYHKTYGPSFDFDGAVALRMTEHIRDFDPARSSLETWSINHAIFACKDVLRMTKSLMGQSRKRCKQKPIKPHSLWVSERHINGTFDPARAHPKALSTTDPLPPWELEEAAHNLLQCLSPRDREIAAGYTLEGMTMSAIARKLGVSEACVCQHWNYRILPFLREFVQNRWKAYA